MKKTIYLLALVFVSSFVIAQEARKVANFDAIDVSGGIYATLIHSNEHKVVINSISGDGDLELITDVSGGTLKIRFESKKKMWNNGSRKAEVDIYYTSLDEVSASAGSKVYGDETIKSDNMDIQASSGSSIKLYVHTQKLDVDVSSGASVNLNGYSDESIVDVSSGASYRGASLETNFTEVQASSGASAKVWVNKEIAANASSGGSVRYKGTPEKTHLDSSKYSGGSIKKM